MQRKLVIALVVCLGSGLLGVLNSGQFAGAAPPRAVTPTDPPLAFLAFYGGGEHGAPERGSIFVADLSGRGIHRLTAPKNDASEPAWSPGARRIAYVQDGWIFVMDKSGRHRRRVVRGNDPRWSPNGKQLAFGGAKTVEVVDVGTRKIRQLRPDTDWVEPAVDWSPDGQTIAFTGAGGLDHLEIYAINVDGAGFRKLVSAPPDVSLDMPRWSPDGKRLLYTWHRNRTTFIYLANADGSNAKRLIRTDADARASWSWDGHRIVYGVVDIRLLNLRTGARRKIDLGPCRRFSCQDLDWSRTR